MAHLTLDLRNVRVATSIPLSHRARLRKASATHPGGFQPARAAGTPQWPSIEGIVGQTPLIRLQKLGKGFNGNVILCKLEGHNPSGSVKDRAALSMIVEAEKQGVIKHGDTLIEAVDASWGVALAMAASARGYRLIVIVPKSAVQVEHMARMEAYGAELMRIEGGFKEAREMALDMQAQCLGQVLDSPSNPDNPLAHLRTTGPELWAQTYGRITHLLVPMDSAGTIMGTSAYLKLMNTAVQIIGIQPAEGVLIPGLRRWTSGQAPAIYQPWRLDRKMDITQEEAEVVTKVLAKKEGLITGLASGGSVSAALRLSAEVQNAVICTIISDRGESHLSNHVYGAGPKDPPACGTAEFWSAVCCLVTGWRGPHWVLFLGQEHRASKQPAAQPWRPDSADVETAVRQALGTRPVDGRGTLLVCHVGSEEEWTQVDPRHPLRVHPNIKLHTLPTLMLFQDSDKGLVATRRTSGDLSGLLGLLSAGITSTSLQPKPLR